MIEYIKLSVAALIPVIVSVVFAILIKKSSFSKLKQWTQQIIIGIVFGIVAIIGTEWGINLNGFVVNSRDAAPIAAGLLFGGPAGIIAGVIGGVERWFSVYWGAGTFTRVACSFSTMLAGFISAFLRRYMFERKRPSIGMATGMAVIMEIFHLTMVMVTNIDNAARAVDVIDTCLEPMVIANGVSVMLSTLIVAICWGEYKGKETLIQKIKKAKRDTSIFDVVQRWLLFVLAVMFAIVMVFQMVLQNNMAVKNASDDITTCLDSVVEDIEDASNAYMIQLSRKAAREISFGYKYNLHDIAERYDFTEVSVIGNDGIIRESSDEKYVGYDMRKGRQSEAFLKLLEDEDELVQNYGPIAMDKNVGRKYAGVAIRNHTAIVQTGYDAGSFQKVVNDQVKHVATNRKVGKTGGVIVLDENFEIASASSNVNVRKIKEIDFSPIANYANDGVVFERVLRNQEKALMASKYAEGYYIMAFYPETEAMVGKKVSVYVSMFSMTILFSVMYILIYLLIKDIVVNQIVKVAGSLSRISDGNLDEVVDVHSNKEFSSLSDDINTMVNTLKRYIAEAAARIDKELEFAKSIQKSALPEPVAMDERYDIYAYMKTAKEVGGDFYDFYMTNDNLLHFLIADVSGKGIPAAMFMMRSKSVIKSLTERGLSVDDVFTSGNEVLCQENDAGMFVTAWQGDLDLNNGQTYFANAGHNLPAIKKKGGKFELLKQKVNLVLGGMEGIPYTLNELQLEPGDIIYLYTDGVTEATNAENELFGDDRLIEVLNAKEYDSLKDICDGVMGAIDGFVKEADQFDDITMVAVEYKG